MGIPSSFKDLKNLGLIKFHLPNLTRLSSFHVPGTSTNSGSCTSSLANKSSELIKRVLSVKLNSTPPSSVSPTLSAPPKRLRLR